MKGFISIGLLCIVVMVKESESSKVEQYIAEAPLIVMVFGGLVMGFVTMYLVGELMF